MKRPGSASAALLLLISLVGPGHASTVLLDQFVNTRVTSGRSSYVLDRFNGPLAQSFRVGVTGELVRVGLQVHHGHASPSDNNLIVGIRRVDRSGQTLSAPLATVRVLPHEIFGRDSDEAIFGEYVHVDFSDRGVFIQEGEMFAVSVAFEAVDFGGRYLWNYFSNPGPNVDIYPQGQGYDSFARQFRLFSSPVDFGFQTFVIPIPEPSTIVIAVFMTFAAFLIPIRRLLFNFGCH